MLLKCLTVAALVYWVVLLASHSARVFRLRGFVSSGEQGRLT